MRAHCMHLGRQFEAAFELDLINLIIGFLNWSSVRYYPFFVARIKHRGLLHVRFLAPLYIYYFTADLLIDCLT